MLSSDSKKKKTPNYHRLPVLTTNILSTPPPTQEQGYHFTHKWAPSFLWGGHQPQTSSSQLYICVGACVCMRTWVHVCAGGRVCVPLCQSLNSDVTERHQLSLWSQCDATVTNSMCVHQDAARVVGPQQLFCLMMTDSPMSDRAVYCT